MTLNKHDVLDMLREHATELRAAGIAHLRLHGSVVRGDSSVESDVDLIAQFDSSKGLTLIQMVQLENRLSDLLGARVELSSQDMLKAPVREAAAREAVLAF